MTTLTIETNKKFLNKDIVEIIINNILEEYTEFDINLMKKYIDTKNLNQDKFINL